LINFIQSDKKEKKDKKINASFCGLDLMFPPLPIAIGTKKGKKRAFPLHGWFSVIVFVAQRSNSTFIFQLNL
jgi:hypothetical protein